MNCNIGFMSFVVISSLIIFFLFASGKVEAEPQCIGLCDMLSDCNTACLKMGYHFGQCIGWKTTNNCCCDH
ncbi:unnamed protein product [Cochlearia groenlandica]